MKNLITLLTGIAFITIGFDMIGGLRYIVTGIGGFIIGHAIANMIMYFRDNQ